VLDWLRVEYEIEKHSNKLLAVAERSFDTCVSTGLVNGMASILSLLAPVLSINARPGGWVKERV
jgi:hypothetical protein